MKKALFILEDINQTGSPQTALHFIEHISKTYEIDVLILCVNNKEIDLARINQYRPVCKNIYTMSLPHMTSKKYKLLYPLYIRKIKQRVKTLYQSAEYNLVYINRINIAGNIFKWIKEKYPITRTMFNSLGNVRNIKESKYFFLRKRDKKTIEWMLNYTDYYIAISEQSVLKEFDDISNKVHILKDYPSIKLKTDEKVFSKRKTIRLGQIGYYCENKNQLYSLNILKVLNTCGFDASISFVGFEIEESKDYLLRMKEFIKNESLESKVIFLDSNYDKIKYFDSIDILLCPSHTEGLPLVLLESQYNKTPCLASFAIPDEANLGGLSREDLNNTDRWIDYLISEEYKLLNINCPNLKDNFEIQLDKIII